MTKELREKIVKYRIALSVLKRMLDAGLITEQDYLDMNTIIAEKCGLISCTIFR